MNLITLIRSNDTKIVLNMTKISHIEPYYPNKTNWNANVSQQNVRKGYVIFMDNGKEIIITDNEFKDVFSDLEDF